MTGKVEAETFLKTRNSEQTKSGNRRIKSQTNKTQKKCPTGFKDKDKFIRGCKKDLPKASAAKCAKLDSCNKIMACIGKELARKKKK